MIGRMTARGLGPALLAGVLGAMATSALADQAQSRTWWVVLGASPAPGSTGVRFLAAQQAAEAARRCGIETVSDFSGKFEGFAPDLFVTVAGDDRMRARAEARMAKVRPCVPGAYLKQGAYAGE